MLRHLLLTRHLTHFQTACYSLLAYLLYSLTDVSVKWLMSEGYDKSIMLVASCIPATIVLMYFLIKRHGIKKCLYTPYKKLQFTRGLSLIAITYFGLEALQHLPLTDFYGVIFSTPLIVTIGAFFIFKERVSFVEWAVIAVGFCGILIIAQPDYANFNIGFIYAFGAVLGVASAGLIVRKIGSDESPFLYIIFGNIAIFVANIAPALSTPLPAITFVHLLILSIYCILIPIAVITMSAVYSRAPSVAAIAPFHYSQIIWGAILGYLIFGDIPQLNTLIGSAIVIGCGLYIVLHHKRKRVAVKLSE